MRALIVFLVGCSSTEAAVNASVADSAIEASSDAATEKEAEIAPSADLLADDFEAHPAGAWTDGSMHGVWRAVSNGYGETTIETDGTRVLRQKPKASVKLDETHASLVLSNKTLSEPFELSLRMKTVAQLRTPTPNAWEVAWVIWHYRDEGHFYYFTPKPNGWELGKVDNSKVDPAGPDCVWPAYMNCKYPGAQRYLATGSSPTFPVGSWYRARVQVGPTTKVYIDDKLVTSFTDMETPYTSGTVGLYNEDAHVEFDDVFAR